MPRPDASPDRPLSVVVVGYGFGGRVFHAPLVAATPGLSLDAIVTADPVRREQAAAAHPEAALYSSVEEAWAGGHDLAAISTANITQIDVSDPVDNLISIRFTFVGDGSLQSTI